MESRHSPGSNPEEPRDGRCGTSREEIHMSLRTHRVRASIAVSDITAAAGFYEGKLGLEAGEDQDDDSRLYDCGGGTSLHLYASPDNAGKSPATLATWYVTDLERVVDELTANGVTFERYDGLSTDSKGIFSSGDVTVAWFEDPDGNTFAIEQHP